MNLIRWSDRNMKSETPSMHLMNQLPPSPHFLSSWHNNRRTVVLLLLFCCCLYFVSLPITISNIYRTFKLAVYPLYFNDCVAVVWTTWLYALHTHTTKPAACINKKDYTYTESENQPRGCFSWPITINHSSRVNISKISYPRAYPHDWCNLPTSISRTP